MGRKKTTYEEFETRLVKAESHLQALLDERLEVNEEAEAVRSARLTETPQVREKRTAAARVLGGRRNEIPEHKRPREALASRYDQGGAEVEERAGELTPGIPHMQAESRKRKRMEAAFEISERNYHEIFNASNKVIVVHDIETGAIPDVDEPLHETFGRPDDNGNALGADDSSQGEDPYTMVHARRWVRKTVTEGPQRFEWMVKRKSGEFFWTEIDLMYAFVGGRDRLLAVVHDITERKRAEVKLARAKTILDNVINRMPNPVYVKNERHQWLMVNDAFCRLKGCSREELLGESDYDCFPGEEADGFREKDNLVFNTGGTYENEEKFTDSDGMIHVALTRKTAMTDERGEKILIGVITDISELGKPGRG